LLFDDVGGGEFGAGFDILTEGERNGLRSHGETHFIGRHAMERIKRIQQSKDNEKTEKNGQKNSFVHPHCHRMAVISPLIYMKKELCVIIQNALKLYRKIADM
jgi:hypothetical protein